MKYKEYWISILKKNEDSNTGEAFVSFNKPTHGAIKGLSEHVIEYSAYKDLIWLLECINDRVFPGEVDSTDALKQIVKEHKKYAEALNRIGIMAMGELAYTRDFTEKTQQIINDALNIKKRWPY